MRKCALLLMLSLLLIAGCVGAGKPKFTEEELALVPLSQRNGLPAPSGGFVLSVSGETITADEVVLPLIEHFRSFAQNSDFERFEEQARPQVEQVLINKVSNILLYHQARKNLGEQADERLEKLAESEVKKFIVSFEGDYAKAEQALKEMGMDWTDFKEYQKKTMLSQWHISTKLPEQKPVTYSELMDCYDRIKDKSFATEAMLEFRLIDIQPAKLKVTDPNQSPLDQARDLADELIERLRAGEDFGQLAKAYSHGHRQMFGGLWKPVQPDSLAKPYDILAAQAETTEPGQIAGPIGAGDHIFIMKLEAKQAKNVEPFEKVQNLVEARIYLERRKAAIDEFSARLFQQAALGDKDEFTNFCLQKLYLMSNQ